MITAECEKQSTAILYYDIYHNLSKNTIGAENSNSMIDFILSIYNSLENDISTLTVVSQYDQLRKKKSGYMREGKEERSYNPFRMPQEKPSKPPK